MRAIPGVGVPLRQAGDRGAARLLRRHGHDARFALRPAPRARKNAVLGYPEVKHGMISAVSAMRLPQVIPSAQALEMMLLARNITADEALRFGLVNAVVDDVQRGGGAWADTIAGLFAGGGAGDQAPRAVLARHVRGGARGRSRRCGPRVETQDDYKQGAAAFSRARDDRHDRQ